MLITKFNSATAVVLAVGVLGTSAGLLTKPALAQKATRQGVKEDGRTVQGILKAVDAGTNTIQVMTSPGKGNPEEKTYAVAMNVQVTIADGKRKDKSAPATRGLADLPIGAVVTLQLSADRKAVESIFAEGPTVKGTIKGVDPTANTITVAVNEGKQLVDKTFDAKSAPVAIVEAGGDKSKASEHRLADLPVGAIATLRFSPALEVVSISAEGPSFAGTVKRVDATARRLTLAFSVAKGETVQEREFDLAADGRLAIDGGTGRTLSELPPGALVKIQLSADQKTVRSIDAEGPTVQGVVTAVDSERFGITIADKVGEKSFLVARDAQITIDGKESEFALLPAGAVVRARLSVDQTTARSISAEGPSAKGKATAVDPTNYSITVYVNKEGDKTFDIAREAKVVTEIYSLPIKLADLKPEKEVNLLLTADRKSVMRITVVGE